MSQTSRLTIEYIRIHEYPAPFPSLNLFRRILLSQHFVQESNWYNKYEHDNPPCTYYWRSYLVYEYSYTRNRKRRYVAHHSSILWVITTAVSMTAYDGRSLAETRPLYSRMPSKSNVSCTWQLSKLVRYCDNSQHTRHLVRRTLDTRTRSEPKASHEFMVHKLALSLALLVFYSMHVQQMIRR